MGVTMFQRSHSKQSRTDLLSFIECSLTVDIVSKIRQQSFYANTVTPRMLTPTSNKARKTCKASATYKVEELQGEHLAC